MQTHRGFHQCSMRTRDALFKNHAFEGMSL